MKAVTMYRDEVSGLLFPTPEEAQASEAKSEDIRDAFGFVRSWPTTLDHSESSCVEHDEAYWQMFRQTLIDMVRKHEPSILASLPAGITLEQVMLPRSDIGRVLVDNSSPFYRWYYQWSNICPVCYREWPTWYLAKNCRHQTPEKEGRR